VTNSGEKERGGKDDKAGGQHRRWDSRGGLRQMCGEERSIRQRDTKDSQNKRKGDTDGDTTRGLN